MNDFIDDDNDFGFDPAQVEAAPAYETIPAGEYVVECKKFETKKSKRGDTYLHLTFEIVEGEHEGRKIFRDFHTQCSAVDSSAEAEEKAKRTRAINQGEFKAFLVAIGVPATTRAADIVDRSCIGRVVISKQVGYDDKNEIKKFRALDGAQPQATKAPAQKPATPASVPASPRGKWR